MVAGAAGDLVDGRVDEAQVAPGVLVGQRDQRGADRGATGMNVPVPASAA